LASAGAFLLLSQVSIAAWLPDLSEQELSTISAALAQRTKVTQRNRETSKRTHPLGLQVLFVEAQEIKNKSQTSDVLADMFLFDYQNVQASVQVVNATSGELIRTQSLDTLYLPLNDTETNYVLELLRHDNRFFDSLSTEYMNQFGVELIDNKTIDMKVSIWVPNENLHANSACFVSRCALVSVFTDHHYNFSIEPIVDLVSGHVDLELVQ